MAEEEERATYSNSIELVLSLISFAVGLGNIWRFPYLVFDNGGGTFLVPYVFALCTLGIPLFVLELGMGQLLREGPVNMWVKLGVPRLRCIGVMGTVTSAMMGFYYIVIVSWALHYMIQTLVFIGNGELPWSDKNLKGGVCPSIHIWPSDQLLINDDFIINETGLFNPKYTNTKANEHFWCGDKEKDGWTLPNATGGNVVKPEDHTYFGESPNQCPAEAAVLYWNEVVLQKSTGIDDLGGLNWPVMLPFTISWVIVYILVFQGVALSGKLVYITSTLPFVCLFVFFFRAVTLEGASDGISFYLSPDFGKLFEPVVWQKAATQIFYSLGVGIGGIVAFGSYGDKNGDYVKHVLQVAIINCGTSVFGGFVVFAVLGFLTNEMSQVNPCFTAGEVPLLEQIGLSGTGLAFIAFPIAISQMPGQFFWAFLFFFMLFLLGIGSTFPFVEGVITVLTDSGYGKTVPRWKSAGLICFLGWFLGMIFMTHAGVYWVTLFDSYIAVVALLLVGTLECVGIMWVNSNIFPNMMDKTFKLTGRAIPKSISTLLKYASPFIMSVIILLSIFSFDLIGDTTGAYPTGFLVLGWLLGLTPVFAMLVVYFLDPMPIPEDTSMTGTPEGDQAELNLAALISDGKS